MYNLCEDRRRRERRNQPGSSAPRIKNLERRSTDRRRDRRPLDEFPYLPQCCL